MAWVTPLGLKRWGLLTLRARVGTFVVIRVALRALSRLGLLTTRLIGKSLVTRCIVGRCRLVQRNRAKLSFAAMARQLNVRLIPG